MSYKLRLCIQLIYIENSSFYVYITVYIDVYRYVYIFIYSYVYIKE